MDVLGHYDESKLLYMRKEVARVVWKVYEKIEGVVGECGFSPKKEVAKECQDNMGDKELKLLKPRGLRMHVRDLIKNIRDWSQTKKVQGAVVQEGKG
ncbi:hypothetical protein NDU88_002099 [Pleurodeles waltl]|uniref:Uncharacterized protein n=1 Tax=Pleurodeles waltl TaxID=8319 RepID=A0AAV7WP10_PLEWA|nr:hypothetical protein NDU88_002099 [Pleurodeles waltl]